MITYFCGCKNNKYLLINNKNKLNFDKILFLSFPIAVPANKKDLSK
jgi:hypothetical protein